MCSSIIIRIILLLEAKIETKLGSRHHNLLIFFYIILAQYVLIYLVPSWNKMEYL